MEVDTTGSVRGVEDLPSPFKINKQDSQVEETSVYQGGYAAEHAPVTDNASSVVLQNQPQSVATILLAPPAASSHAAADNNQPESATVISASISGVVVARSSPACSNRNNAVTASPIAPPDATITASTTPVTVNQATISAYETLSLHPTDSTKLIARFRVELPHAPGTYYEQIDEIPVRDETASSPAKPGFYFIRDLTNAKIPQRRRANKKNNHQGDRWTRQASGEIWTRPGLDGKEIEVWEPIVVFRRFNATTQKYEQIYINLSKLKNVDPNDKMYQYAYNKWIDQIRRRRDGTYVQVVNKDHWTHAERRALYAAINAFVRKAGLRNFGFGSDVTMNQKDIQVMTDAVNTVGGKNRHVDAVRGQISSAHLRKNKAIYDLLQRAQVLRDRLDRDEIVPRKERYPQEAILPSLFPPDANTTPSSRMRGPRPRGEVGNSVNCLNDSEADLTDTPEDMLTPACQPTLRATSPDLASILDTKAPGLPPYNRAAKFEDADGNEIAGVSDTWMDTDGEGSDCQVESEFQEDMEWETYSEQPVDEDLAREEALNVQVAILQSVQDQARAVIRVPGHSKSDIDSESDSSAPTTVTPARKRKRILDTDEETGSDGDDEADMAPPQTRAIKRTRSGERR
jgi:hypothetical protein